MEKTVLLVEDNPDEILLARRAFRKAGLASRLLIADGGAQACRLLQHHDADAPSVILLDWQMPDTDGLAVLRMLRDTPHTARLPVVVLSSSNEPHDIAAAYAAGANSYLRKPVDFDRFVQLIQDIHRYWLVHNTLAPPTLVPPATRSLP